MKTRSLPAALGLLLLTSITGCVDGPDPIALIEDQRAPRSDRLVRELVEGDAARKARAALAMGRIQSDYYAQHLARAAQSRDARVRLAALFALGQLGLPLGARPPEPAVAGCLQGLERSGADAATLAAAVEALGKLASGGTADRIVSMLDHPAPDVRAEAAHALFRLRFVPVWRREAAEPPPLRDDALDALIGVLDDPSAEVRRAAAHALSRYGEPRAVGALMTRTADSDEWTRLFAIRAAGRCDDTSAVGGLLKALGDESFRVRSEAVTALARLGEVERYPAGLAADPSFHVRAALAAALGQAQGEESLAALQSLEADASPTVRAASIDALARRLGSDYAPALARHAGAEAWTIRRAAAAAGHVGPSGGALIEAALADDDNRVRAAALEAAGETVGQERRLLEALASTDLALRGTATTWLAGSDRDDKLERLDRVYRESAGTEWIEIREAVIDGAGSIDGAEQLLTAIARGDPEASVRARARQALLSQGHEAPEIGAPLHEPSAFLGTVFEQDPVIVLETSRGEIVIRGLADEAPLHVANFVELARKGFYDGLVWHRVVSNFVIQGGDPRGDGWGGPGYTLRDEINTERFGRGAVGMPKAGKDTGGCQIFITHVPTPHLDGNYTVFGRVESGMDVVDAIEVGDRILRARVR